MSLPKNLLSQASHLATREPRRPTQASLRRAISAAYYAVFHLITTEGAELLLGGSPALDTPRMLLNRAYEHGPMRAVCLQFSKSVLPSKGGPNKYHRIIPAQNPPEVRLIAEDFAELQARRHSADYDTRASFSRSDALEAVKRAEDVFQRWAHLKKHHRPELCTFVAALLLADKARV